MCNLIKQLSGVLWKRKLIVVALGVLSTCADLLQLTQAARFVGGLL